MPPDKYWLPLAAPRIVIAISGVRKEYHRHDRFAKSALATIYVLLVLLSALAVLKPEH